MTRLRSLIVSLMAVAVPLACTSSVRSQALVNDEPKIKAGIVALLAKFVTWPEGAAPAEGEPLKIGILGEDPFERDGVNYLSGRLAGQNVVVQRFADPDAYKPCHILVVSRTADWETAKAKTEGQHVLVICESPGLAEQGAVVNLVLVQNRIQMQINLDAVKLAQLHIDPAVYRLPMVKRIRNTPEPP